MIFSTQGKSKTCVSASSFRHVRLQVQGKTLHTHPLMLIDSLKPQMEPWIPWGFKLQRTIKPPPNPDSRTSGHSENPKFGDTSTKIMFQPFSTYHGLFLCPFMSFLDMFPWGVERGTQGQGGLQSLPKDAVELQAEFIGGI